MQRIKQIIPWTMAAGRALLGPVVLVGNRSGWSGLALAAMVVTALLSDIFDGVLARRWRVDIAAVRLCDSLCDTVFYACVAVALWPRIWNANAPWLAVLLGLEGANVAFALLKFGRPASYHSYLAKSWGAVLALAVVTALVSNHTGPVMRFALLMGICSNLETMAMSLVLPTWRSDVKTLAVALRIRKQNSSGSAQGSRLERVPTLRHATFNRRIWIVALTSAVMSVALPSVALAQSPKAHYYGGTAGLTVDASGSFDTASSSALLFNCRRSDGAAGQLAINYDVIEGIEPRQEPMHQLGVLPFIAVSLVTHPLQRYLITINYSDAHGTAQIAVFELAKRDQAMLVSIVNARSPRGCVVNHAPCPPALVRR